MIVAKEVGIELAQLGGVGHTAFAMALRRGLISHQMMRNAEHPIRHDKTCRAFGRSSDREPLLRNAQWATAAANTVTTTVQTGERLNVVLPLLDVSLSR